MLNFGKTSWDEGIKVLENFDEIDCSRCGEQYRYESKGCKTWVTKRTPLIRFFPDSHGYLCLNCYTSAPLCPCGELAIERITGLCRECYIGKETKQPIENLIYKAKEDVGLYAPVGQNEED